MTGRIVRLTEDDTHAALALSTAAGWNQTEDDWRLLLSLGSGFGIRDSGNRLAATMLTVHYEAVDWQAMLLVAPDVRGRGMGSHLFEHVVAQSDRTGRPSALDATPMGRPIYEQRGFTPILELVRMHRRGKITGTSSAATAQARDGQPGRSDHPIIAGRGTEETETNRVVARFAEIDGEIVGSPRRELFARLANRRGTRFLFRGNTTPAAPYARSAEGVAVLRAGRVAEQIGPLYARTESDAIDLLSTADAETEGDTFIDVRVGAQHRFAEVLESLGYSGRRTFTRMVKRSPGAHESSATSEKPTTAGLETLAASMALAADPARIYAIAGPEYG